jgi:alkylmercury lyase
MLTLRWEEGTDRMAIHDCCNVKAAEDKISLDDVAARTVEAFPTLNLLERRVSLQLYRLLAEGHPVPRGTLARRLGISVETVNGILDRWLGVFADSRRRIVGYWGLALPAAYASPHELTIGGQKLSAWCAWDTLFLPQLLGQTAEIESASPDQGATVRLTVTPERVERVQPVGARMSYLLPDATAVQKDVVGTFCHFIHFFASRQAGESWAAQHSRIILLSIDEACALARRKNEMQYGEVLT